MRKTLILAAVAALAFTTIADAKNCTDPKTHKYVKCPAAAAAPANKPAAAPSKKMQPAGGGTIFTGKPTTTASASGAPHCTKGKPCGKSCIAMDKVCHK